MPVLRENGRTTRGRDAPLRRDHTGRTMPQRRSHDHRSTAPSRRHNGFYRLHPTLATTLVRKCDSDRASDAGRAIIPAYSKPELKIVSSPFSSERKR